MRSLIAAAIAVALLSIPAAQAEQFQMAGLWHCTVNAQSNDPAGNYGLDVQVQVADDGSLYAKGLVLYHALMNNQQPVEGYGDWSVLPPEPNAAALIKFRMQPSSHPIITWFARPVGVGQMYNMFNAPPENGRAVAVETQCNKYG